jgi:hypothetical protein
MVLYFGGILLIIPKCLRYKKELLELLWEKGVEILAGIWLKNLKCYHSYCNICCLYFNL